jgi:hypothetical protein
VKNRALVVVLVAMPMVAAAAPPTVELRAPEAIDVGVGATAVVSLTVAPPSGRSISSDGPLVVELGGGDGVALPRRRYSRRDAADPAAEAPRFDLRVRGVAAGEHPVAIAVRLWLCGKHTCRPVRVQRTVQVRVAPAQGSPTAPGS